MAAATTRASGATSRVDCKAARGRRELHFDSLDEVLADAQRLAAAPNIRMLGNWPLPRLLMHLATAINSSIDGISAKAPWYIRLVGPLIRRRILVRQMSPGFRLPAKFEPSFFPESASSREAAEKLQSAVGRVHNERMTAKHPVLGSLTHEQWTQLHLRHAEMHLSFAVPD